MKGELPNPKQSNLFQPNLHQIVNPAHELVLLAQKIKWKPPCDPTDWVYFRKRIGETGVEKIFQYSV